MFKPKNSDLQKSLTKLSDTKKDLRTRFRHLKVILEHKDPAESKKVLSEDPEEVFRVFTECFHALDQSLKLKGQKVNKEDVENVLFSLERILLLLPEYIRIHHDHLGVISVVLKRCLHPNSSLRLRRDAMRPFLIYYQILRDSSGEDVHQLFLLLVPGLVDHTVMGPGQRVNAEEVFLNTPPLLLPPTAEKLPEHLSRFMFETLMDLLVSQVFRIQWDHGDQFFMSFSFLFERFKLGYLSRVFPHSGSCGSLVPGTPVPSSPNGRRMVTGDSAIFSLQVATLKWIVTFLQNPENLKAELPLDPAKKRNRENSVGSDNPDHAAQNPSQPSGRLPRESSSSGFTAAVHSLLHFDVGPSNSALDNKFKQTYGSNVFLLVRHTLLSLPVNVQLVHDLFETAFNFPLSEFAVIRRVINVYQNWIVLTEGTKGHAAGQDHVDSGSRPANQHLSSSGQNALRLFCINSVPQFNADLVATDISSAARNALLDEQEDICKRIISVYRVAITSVPMTLSTWERVLSTLIRITQLLMPNEPPKDRLSVLCGRLAMPLFQTLLNAWVKGTLSAIISPTLWDDVTHILSKLTAWDELVVRWEKTLELITRMFADEVFGISSGPALESGQSNASLSPLNHSSDDGTLTATEQLRSRSSASSDTDQLVGFVLSGSCRSDTSGTGDDGSITEIPELDETEGGKTDTLKAGEDFTSISRRMLSDEQAEEIRIHFSDIHANASRSSSTPDSLRESLNSPLFYPLTDADRKRASSASSSISVMAGGPYQGWSPDSACALWFRVFGLIGPVNNIRQPANHKFTLQSVKRIVDMLHSIQQRASSVTNSLTRPTILPVAECFQPVSIIAPLLLETMDLDERFRDSHVIALEMLLQITFRAEKLPRKYLVQLYRVLHRALLSNCPEIIDVILTGAGMRLFCSELPNSVLLLEDVVMSVKSLINSPQPVLQLTCVRLLASILFFIKRLPDSFSVFAPAPDAFGLRKCDRSLLVSTIREIVLQYTNIALAPSVRISALYCVGSTLHQIMESGNGQPSTLELYLETVLRALENYAGEGALDVANILLILTSHAPQLAAMNCSLVVNVVEVICSVLQRMTADIPEIVVDLSKDIEEMLIKLVFCLCEWVSAVPAVMGMAVLKGDKSIAVRSVVDKAITSLLTLSEPVKAVEQDDQQYLRVEDVKGKGKRALSDHLLFDRRYSADVGAMLGGKVAQEEEPVLTRRTTLFGRPPPEPPKDKEKKPVVPLVDVRTQNVFSDGRLRTLRLTGSYAARHMVNLFQNMPDFEAYTSPSSLVTEDECVSADGTLLDNIQVFALHDIILTVIKIDRSAFSNPAGTDAHPLLTSFREYPGVRLIVRDIAGKYCYDLTSLFGTERDVERLYQPGVTLTNGQSSSVLDRLPDRTLSTANVSIQTVAELKVHHSDDVVLDVLKYVDKTSPDLGLFRYHDWTEPGPSPPGLTAAEEHAASVLMQEQHLAMEECVNEKKRTNKYCASESSPESFGIPDAVFGYCSRVLSQLGYAAMAKRQYFHLLNRSEDMFRDLKLLDKRANRDTHKFAVIYVARGQEDKMSIMTNSFGSPAYERFVKRLGKEIDVTEHKGFRGGLLPNSHQFRTAVYYASATVEIIYHVATQIVAVTSEEHTAKMRHIGNDEVQIVWSDHYRDYDRRHMPTQFGDVIICIYPIEPAGLYRIQILQRGHIPQFGPLFDGAMVDEENLAGLIRSTALFAGRACRKQIRGYQPFFEERADYVRSLIQGHSFEAVSTYEAFFASIISPQTPKLQLPLAQIRDVNVSLRPTWRESQRRYKERAKSVAFQDRPDALLRVKGESHAPALGTRFSIPLQLGVASTATDV